MEVFPKTQEDETGEEDNRAAERRQKAFSFDFKPSQIKEHLDRFVIQQDDAKKVLATAVCDHYHHIQSCHNREECRDYKKQNIVIIGPTGVGKTYLIQNIARLIGVPFVKADATKFSETGYVGGDVEDLIRELVQQADGDIQLAEYGIVYLDEIDKISTPSSMVGRDVSGRGVQRGLLKMMEETDVPLRSPTDIASQMQAFIEFQSKGSIEKKTISTKHILFIVSGAFTGLSEIIKKRLGARQIGFLEKHAASEEEKFLLERVRSVDFIEYGFEAEFIGRLPVVVHCNSLSVDDLFNILKYSEGSLLKQYKKDFLAYGVDVFFTDDGMKAIAQRAAQEETGARGLMTVCEKIFREYKYALPDHPEVREFVVTGKTIEEPTLKLEELLKKPGLYRPRVLQFKLGKIEKEIADTFKVRVAFSPEASELLADRAESAGRDVVSYCRDLFQNYEHGFNLLGKTRHESHFTIDAEFVKHPMETLDRWIKENYQ